MKDKQRRGGEVRTEEKKRVVILNHQKQRMGAVVLERFR